MITMRRYSAAFILFAFFLGSWALQWYTHDGTTQEFVNATMENWQSEFLQIITAAFVFKHFRWVDAPEDKGEN